MDNKIKELFKKEGLTWAKFTEVAGGSAPQNFRLAFLGWINKTNKALNAIGYYLVIKKKETDGKK
ncbi:MAG: hypothetical protein WBP45_14940 [Daejeonella sp.]